jgi:hypothetical protein
MSERRFPPPWTLEKIPGGLKVCDANGQSLAYVYSRENPHDAHMAKVHEATWHSEQHRQAANTTRQRGVRMRLTIDLLLSFHSERGGSRLGLVPSSCSKVTSPSQ